MKKNIIVILVLLLIYVCIIVCWNASGSKKPTSQTEGQENKVKFNLLGVGFVISEDGYVLTAHHVIRDALTVKGQKVVLYLYDENEDISKRTYSNEKSVVAEVVHSNPNYPGYPIDLAILKITHRINKDKVEKEAKKRFEAYKSAQKNVTNSKQYDDVLSQIYQDIETEIVAGTKDELLDTFLNNKESENAKPEDKDILALPFHIKDHQFGKLVCIPGAVSINTDETDENDKKQPHAKIPFFMYCARVAGGELNAISDLPGNRKYFVSFFDKSVHEGMSGAPVINSNGEIIAMITENISKLYKCNKSEIFIPLYSKGLSSQSILDEIKIIINNNKNSELASDLQKIVNKAKADNSSANPNPKFKNFPELDNTVSIDTGLSEISELRKSIVFIKVYKNFNYIPEEKKGDSTSDKTK